MNIPQTMRPQSELQQLPVSQAQGLPTIVKPRATPQEVTEALSAFMEIKNHCLDPNDVMLIGADGGPTSSVEHAVARHVKKSGWRKIALAFGFDCTVSDPVFVSGEDRFGKFFTYQSTATIIAPNGRTWQDTGACSSRNPFFSKKKGVDIAPSPEDIMLMAQTVAINRAVSGIVGCGEISAEEYRVIVERKEEPPRFKLKKQKEETAHTKAVEWEKTKQLSDLLGDDIPATPEQIKSMQGRLQRANKSGMSMKFFDKAWNKCRPGVTVNELLAIEEYLDVHWPGSREASD